MNVISFAEVQLLIDITALHVHFLLSCTVQKV